MLVEVPFPADDHIILIQFQIILISHRMQGIISRTVFFTLARIGFHHILHLHGNAHNRAGGGAAEALELVIAEVGQFHRGFGQRARRLAGLGVEVDVFISINRLIPDLVIKGHIKHHTAPGDPDLVHDRHMPGTGVGVKTALGNYPACRLVNLRFLVIAASTDKTGARGGIGP